MGGVCVSRSCLDKALLGKAEGLGTNGLHRPQWSFKVLLMLVQGGLLSPGTITSLSDRERRQCFIIKQSTQSNPHHHYLKMADSKTYLNVPFAQKDAAKALGARWDAANKKWYVPADKDITLFAQWQPLAGTPESPSTTTSKPREQTSSTNNVSSANNAPTRVITYPVDKNFVAYNGDEPPWD